jgi:uncharacterized RDD family membrane protein YckC
METAAPDNPAAPAVLWRRALSRLIDLVVLVLLMLGVTWLLFRPNVLDFPADADVLIFILCAWEILVPGLTRGASLGRALLRIRIVRERDGGTPGWIQYAARTFARYGLYAAFVLLVAYEIDDISLAVVCIIEGLMVVFNKRRQSIGDLVARTVVVDQARAQSPKA